MLTSTVARRFNLVLSIDFLILASGNFWPHSYTELLGRDTAGIGEGFTVMSRPGDTEFTLILGAQITASVLARWICAALVTA